MKKLIKTNSKEYQTRFNKFLFDAIDFSNYDIPNPSTLGGRVIMLYKIYLDEYTKDGVPFQNRTHQDNFAEWLSGLPSSIYIPYRNYEIEHLIGELYGVDPADIPAKKLDKMVNNYWSFISVKFFQILNKL